MTLAQSESTSGTPSTLPGPAQEATLISGTASASRAMLRDQVRRRLSTGARGLDIDVCHDSATVILTGTVNSFYAKQILYQICRLWTPGLRVIDTTVVTTLPGRQD